MKFSARALLVSLIAMAAAGCGVETKTVPQAFVGHSSSRNTSLTLVSMPADAGARCWYFLESGRRPSLREALGDPSVRSISVRGIPDQAVKDALKKAASDNLTRLVATGSGATGMCTGAILSATAAITSLITPGAQVVSPVAFVLTLSQVMGCGFTGKAAAEALWAAWVFHRLDGRMALTDLNKGAVREREEMIRTLLNALDVARFHETGSECPAPSALGT